MFDEKLYQREQASPQQSGPKMEKPPAIDGRIELSYDNSGMLCNMTLYGPVNGGRPITMDTVARELKRKGIVACVDEFDLRDMVDNQVYEQPTCIARAVPAKRGVNGTVEFRYEKKRVIQPKYDEFGVANYRELDTIVKIRKGDIIAEIFPPTPGEPGMNIFGEALPPEAGKEARPAVGKNSVISADGRYIIAACDGHIVYGVGCFNVEDTVTVFSDLDISVGNIDFFGDVHIRGNVMEGFSVKAGKNIRIDGSVFSSEISAGGNVTVVGGVIGSTVKSEGNFSAGFCQSSNINAKGSVESKEFVFCDIFCYGELKAKSNGTIVGGKITAMRDITAGTIGSDKYTRTVINIGDGSVTFARKRKAENELAQYADRYDNAVKNLEYLKQRKIQQGGVLSDEQQKLVKVETQNKLFSTIKKKELNLLIAQLDSDIKNKDNLSATCARLYPGASFCINFLTLEITEVLGKSRVTIIGDQLVVVPN